MWYNTNMSIEHHPNLHAVGLTLDITKALIYRVRGEAAEVPFAEILKTLDQEIQQLLGCSKSTISYHAAKLGMNLYDGKKYDWEEIKRYQIEGHSYQECKDKYQFGYTAWLQATKQGLVINTRRTRPRLSDTELFSKSEYDEQSLDKKYRRRNSSTLRIRLIKLGILEKSLLW